MLHFMECLLDGAPVEDPQFGSHVAGGIGLRWMACGIGGYLGNFLGLSALVQFWAWTERWKF